MSKSHLKSHQNHWTCVVFAWTGRFLIFYISGTKIPACVGENSGIPVWLGFFFFLKLNLIILYFIYYTLNLYRY